MKVRLVNRIKNIILKIKLYGIRSLYDKVYLKEASRRRRNRRKTLRDRVIYGKNYNRNVHKYKKRLIFRDGRKCFWCQKTIPINKMTIDHIKPVSQGGAPTDLNNMRLIDDECRVIRDRLIQKGLLKV